MILTCPQCQAQYALAPEKLGTQGRTVRCIGCSHTWYQKPESAPESDNIEDIFKQIHTVIHEQPVEPEQIEQKTVESAVIFDEIMQKVNAKEAQKKQEISATIITHNPLGVNATSFGILTFFLCLSITTLALFAAQRPIVRHFPQMALLYKSIGIHPTVPGAELRLSEMEAEEKMEDKNRMLTVAGKITNMSEDEISAPPLRVILKDKNSDVLKEWDIPAADAKIASGATVPIRLQLKDTPTNGVNAEIRIQDK